MESFPPVIALIITYRRLDLAKATIKSVREKVAYPNIGFHIADDGSGPDYIKALCQEIGPSYSVTVTDAKRGGVGRNMNLGIKAVLERGAEFWLHLEDDWILPKPLDLRPCVEMLAENPNIGMVRLGRLSAGIQGETIAGAGRIWWQLRRASDTYVFSGNAALRHRRFWEAYGPYREGLAPGQTELVMCNQFNTKDGPGIVWPAWLNVFEMFQHIGDSQSFKWMMETGGMTAEQAAEKFEGMKP